MIIQVQTGSVVQGDPLPEEVVMGVIFLGAVSTGVDVKILPSLSLSPHCQNLGASYFPRRCSGIPPTQRHCVAGDLISFIRANPCPGAGSEFSSQHSGVSFPRAIAQTDPQS